jgi:hypothetical protein
VNRGKLGRSIMSFVLVVGAVISTAVDWNATHLFNPNWHPHARFHGALFLMILDAMTVVALWLLWRRSKEPEIGLKVAALFVAAVWMPFLYIETLVPGSSLLASEDVPVLKVAGMTFAPNLVVAAVLLLLTAIAYWIAREPRRNA